MTLRTPTPGNTRRASRRVAIAREHARSHAQSLAWRTPNAMPADRIPFAAAMIDVAMSFQTNDAAFLAWREEFTAALGLHVVALPSGGTAVEVRPLPESR